MAEESIFVIINNIPKQYRSANLRNFFTEFVETAGFLCFHFRHRPEVQKKVQHDTKDSSSIDEQKCVSSRCVTSCCIVKLKADRSDEFFNAYNKKHWIDKNGETLMTCCFIKKIKLLDSDEDNSLKASTANKRGIVAANLPADREVFLKKDLDAMIEMHPPSVMPNGNVGTPTAFFLKAIQACKLPVSVISKLGLQFPRTRSRRIYSNVPFEYAKKRNGSKIDMKKNIPFPLRTCRNPMSLPENFDSTEKSDEESEEEEWDRHAMFNDDVTGQERNKERLFEQEIELKWEKGGSGLVFYTDAQFWDGKDGDFDAKTADDWDIDTSIYHEPDIHADKDARDMMKMRLEEYSRNEDAHENKLKSFASFEKYSKGFGRKILESQGWTQGQGVGKTASGIAEPLGNDGQHPRDKKGLGYHGEKLKREPSTSCRKRRKFYDDEDYPDVHIATIFDEPQTKISSDSVLTSSFFTRLKYHTQFSRADSEELG